MDELLVWLYGKSSKNAHIRKMALDMVTILKKENSLDHSALCERLGIGFDSYQKPRRTFYSVVNPLKKVQLVRQTREYTDQQRKAYKTVYYLDPSAFFGYMKKTLDDFHSQLKA